MTVSISASLATGLGACFSFLCRGVLAGGLFFFGVCAWGMDVMVEALTVVNHGSSSQPSALLACRKVSTSFGKGPLGSSAVMVEERAVA